MAATVFERKICIILQSIRLKTSDRAYIKFEVGDNIYYGQCKILVF